MSDPVNVSVEGSVGIIELARPEKSNCLSLKAHECISRAREK
ncbi:enoyl-CoA hydratase/isomerase family protein, partial [Salmonella enterica subsp. enterica serovar 4:-:1,2]|nr:enoyl-CoA hydratase/isomerase family protein [Salmonella enterica subsp. enterica serovar 4:-:1,2]